MFFGKTAVVTFGGAYAVLAYVAQRAVEGLHWLRPGEMVDGLALAETTPGPLIMVLQFVGFLAAYRYAGPLDPWLAALLGEVHARRFGPIMLDLPNLATLEPVALLLSLAALIATLRFKWGMGWTLLACGVAGWLYRSYF